MNINSFGSGCCSLPLKVLIVFFLFAASAFADQQLDRLGEAAVKDGLTEGAVILVRQNGRVLHSGAYGTAAEGSVFDLASLTKVYAATLAVMRLTDLGLIDPSDKVGRFFPQFREGEKAGVTVEHLLRHRAGLPAWEPLYCAEKPKDYLLNMPLQYPPGSERIYSDLGFMILGMIAEQVSGMSLDEFVNEQFYKPMGLKTAGFKPADVSGVMPTLYGGFEAAMIKDGACRKRFREEVLKGAVNDGNARMVFGGAAGHAGLFSSAEDLAALTEMITDGKHIKPETVRRFMLKDEAGQGMGFAMTVQSLHAEGITNGTFGHLGFTGTSAVSVPEKGLSVIILTNRQMKGLDKKGRYPDLREFRKAVFGESVRLADKSVLK
ncbi:serine hydrolase domain-containing protein [Geovibrio ferrireducens]|uniref:serine hydrolase domain-containing protein n=1 Tax=Geovibrio ferrireducens TaxID=46201 RepID=UPI002245F65E|nr:serine hydrolase domain-containing protein [Geovibrio ferrireducens]